MSTWRPLRLGDDPKVERHPIDAGRLRVTVPLLPSPDEVWHDYFNQRFMPNVVVSRVRPPPRCRLDCIVTEPADRDGELEAHLDEIRERLRATNEWYATKYLPACQRAAAHDRAAQDEERALSAGQGPLKKS